MDYAKLHLVLVVSDYANLCRKRNFSSLLNEEVLSEQVPRVVPFVKGSIIDL